jgi:hypothetical protein
MALKTIPTVSWKKDNYENEKGEFERTAKEFSSKDSKIIRENIKYLKDEYLKSNLTKLNSTDWRKMQNTDSWKTDTLDKIKKAFIQNNEHRDLSRISDQFANGKVSAPIALRLGNGDLYLVAGNTRLMMCKATKVQPNIIIVNTDW